MNRLNDLCNVVRGQLMGAVAEVGTIVTDRRQIEPGDVFWAIRGPNHDGADFVDEAFARGAAGVVVNRTVDVPEGRWAVRVDDPQQALRQWAAWNRQRFAGTVIAVTGSLGKSTARQMIHTVLRTRLNGSASPRNLNNLVGVPLSMLRVEPQHDYAVFELEASHRGEIASLASLCVPKVGVITRVDDAHPGGFSDRRGIAEATAELIEALPADGRAVLGDDPWLRQVAVRCRADVTWVGTSDACDLRAIDVGSDGGHLSFQVAIAGATCKTEDCEFRVPVWGRHHLSAALAAVAVGRMAGFDLPEMADALADYCSLPSRCEVAEVRGATIINDTGNSATTATQAAQELIRDFDAPGRRIVVYGDMGEVGERSVALHWRLGRQVVTLANAELLIACGRFARHMVAGARSAGMPRGRAIACETVDEALPYLGQVILPGDVVLVRGSRRIVMERVVEALAGYPRRRSA